MPILRLALPTPLRRLFDYLPPATLSADTVRALQPGIRVRVPFGRRELVGWLVAVSDDSDIPDNQLKPALAILDDQPLLPDSLWQLLAWTSRYYHHPLGETLATAMPALLRNGDGLLTETETVWQLTTAGHGLPEGGLKRAPKQAQCLALLQQQTALSAAALADAGVDRATLKRLEEKALIAAHQQPRQPHRRPVTDQPPALMAEQLAAVRQCPPLGQYGCLLLEGITGSGKTEVYLQLISQCLAAGRQALILIPEIGLTPQTVQRFQQRFGEPIALLHSGLTDRERLLAWQQARSGEAAIVIGTRSAVFTPLARPGLIIVDEEHDGSYKQQDGLRYSARDLANKRAHLEHTPIVLGSATPSLETLQHALSGHYHHSQLTARATGASHPPIEMLDLRHQPLQEGFSAALLAAIGDELRRGNQVLVFINRRGFAPIMLCHDCGWLARCEHCDANLTVHRQQRQLRCHHCGWQQALPRQCPQCHSSQINYHGPGTERCEQFLQQQFPDLPVWRIDRDSTSRKQAMAPDYRTGQWGRTGNPGRYPDAGQGSSLCRRHPGGNGRYRWRAVQRRFSRAGKNGPAAGTGGRARRPGPKTRPGNTANPPAG